MVPADAALSTAAGAEVASVAGTALAAASMAAGPAEAGATIVVGAGAAVLVDATSGTMAGAAVAGGAVVVAFVASVAGAARVAGAAVSGGCRCGRAGDLTGGCVRNARCCCGFGRVRGRNAGKVGFASRPPLLRTCHRIFPFRTSYSTHADQNCDNCCCRNCPLDPALMSFQAAITPPDVQRTLLPSPAFPLITILVIGGKAIGFQRYFPHVTARFRFGLRSPFNMRILWRAHGE